MHDPELRDNPVETVFKRPPTRPFDFQRHIHSMSHPKIPQFLERIRTVIDRYPNRFTVAEVGGPFPMQEMKAFTQGDRRLNSAYAFDFLYAPELSADLIRSTLSEWSGQAGEGWPSWAFSNHDAPRAVSRWRKDCNPAPYAKLLALLLSSFRGNIFVYQGEELGLPQAQIAYEDLQDPEALTNWPETLGRDGARTPMPWKPSNAYAGFLEVKPWLPIGEDHKNLSVSAQSQDPASVLNFYKRVLSFRKNSPALRHGNIEFIECAPEMLIIKRWTEFETRLCVFNLTALPLTLPQMANVGAEISVGAAVSDGSLAPYSGFVSAAL